MPLSTGTLPAMRRDPRSKPPQDLRLGHSIPPPPPKPEPVHPHRAVTPPASQIYDEAAHPARPRRFAVFLGTALPVAHALWVAHEVHVVAGNGELVGPTEGCLRVGDRPASPLTVVCNQHHRGRRHHGLRLYERLHASPGPSELLKVLTIRGSGRSRRFVRPRPAWQPFHDLSPSRRICEGHGNAPTGSSCRGDTVGASPARSDKMATDHARTPAMPPKEPPRA